EAALEEGVEIEYLTAPEEILEKNGRVAGLRCIKMELGKPDGIGRSRPIPIQGSAYQIEADLVIPAVGQIPDTITSKGIQGLAVTPMKTIRVNPETLATSVEGVFAGGDAITGAATVIEAIAVGKKAAAAIDAFINGMEKPKQPPVPLRRLQVDRIETSAEKLEQLQRPKIPLLALDKRKTTFEAVEIGLSKKVARDEAKRCLRCDLS
ncbi:MAG: FAD-dependent oxidoreductase, partial [Proteobacteria bacterium]|nr:FAD-dependent oxidoreductase [Pseudomonadota bacterium]